MRWKKKEHVSECKVTDVNPKKEAWLMGVRPGDRVLRYNGNAVTRNNFSRLKWILESSDNLEQLELELYRAFLPGKYKFYKASPESIAYMIHANNAD